ncbi:MAG: hypothetical protein WDN31_02620 [Hyphomicrobium sp.]
MNASRDSRWKTTLGEQIKSGLFIAGRFAGALLIANFIAITAGLQAFEKEINAAFEAEYQSSNHALYEEAAQRVDAELERDKASQQELSDLVSHAAADERKNAGLVG